MSANYSCHMAMVFVSVLRLSIKKIIILMFSFKLQKSKKSTIILNQMAIAVQSVWNWSQHTLEVT